MQQLILSKRERSHRVINMSCLLPTVNPLSIMQKGVSTGAYGQCSRCRDRLLLLGLKPFKIFGKTLPKTQNDRNGPQSKKDAQGLAYVY